MTNTTNTATHPLVDAYHEALQGEPAGPNRYKNASRRAVRTTERDNPSAMDQIDEIAERVTFTRRRYGHTFYTWASDGQDDIGDPYPASRFPHAALRVAIAQHISH